MSNPIKLQIRKRILVPTYRNPKYDQSIAWKPIAYVDYEESRSVFYNIPPNVGPIRTDAQFAKLLADNFGDGEYSVMAWKHGRKGFWPFIQLIIEKGFFRRTEPKINKELKEAREHSHELKRLQKEVGGASSDWERGAIEKDIKYREDMLVMNKEILKLSKDMKKGPYPYLRTVSPVYREHELEEYKKEHKGEVVDYDRGMESIW